MPYKTPGELADAADTGAWDIGLIGAEPQRAEKIAFTAAYARSRRPIWCRRARRLKAIADVDKAGVRIAVTGRSAYGLWLDRNIKHATLVRTDTLDSAYEQFVSDKLPQRSPSPSSAWKRGVSCGVEMIRISRIPAIISVASG